MNAPASLEALLDTLPTKPGCYIMKDQAGKVIYVGKAINLRNRVRSYFHSSARHDPKTQPTGAQDQRYRMDRSGFRAGSLDPGDEPDQEAPPALQRPPER